jgi:hypothetical protein
MGISTKDHCLSYPSQSWSPQPAFTARLFQLSFSIWDSESKEVIAHGIVRKRWEMDLVFKAGI